MPLFNLLPGLQNCLFLQFSQLKFYRSSIHLFHATTFFTLLLLLDHHVSVYFMIQSTWRIVVYKTNVMQARGLNTFTAISRTGQSGSALFWYLTQSKIPEERWRHLRRGGRLETNRSVGPRIIRSWDSLSLNFIKLVYLLAKWLNA
jgi:hypothetical protein